MLNGTHERQGENGHGEIETIYKTKKGKKILRKQINGRWFTFKD